MKQLLLTITSLFIVFASIATAQTVTSISPSLNSDDVSVTSNITINFSEAMDNTSITSSTVIVSGSQRGIYSGSFSYGANSATFDPDESFFAGETISVIVTDGVENASNTPISSPYRSMFTAQASGDGEFSTSDGYTVDGASYADWSITADINEDGYVDIITLVPSQDKLSVFTNDGDGTFTGPTNYTTLTAQQLEAKDVDKDGSVDLVTSNVNANMMSIFMNDGSGTGTFTSRIDYGNGSSWAGKALTTGDIDNDGDEDVLIDILSTGIDSIQVFLNDGDGTYTVSDGISTTDQFEQIKLWDIDGDEDLDFVGLSPGLGQLVTYDNDGAGAFSINTVHTATSSSVQFTLANFVSSSADIEAITTDQGADEIRYFGDAINAFGALPETILVGDGPTAIASGDLDGDGHIDVVVSNATDQNLSILMNDGSASFTESNYSTTGTYANYISLADVDNDGDLDIVMANQDGTLTIADNFEGTQVTSIAPADASTDVASNSNISVQFNDAMKASTLNSTNVTVVGNTAGTIAATYTYNSGDSSLTIDPSSDFILGDEITVTVTTNVMNEGDQAIASSASSTFTVEGVNVQSSLPATNAVAVAANSDIDITFNDTMDEATLTTSNILVFGSLSGKVAGAITTGSNSASFNPTSDFIAGELVYVIVTTGVENSSNVAMDSPSVFQFTVDGSVAYVATEDTVKSTGTAPTDVAIFDVDVDGNLDLVVTNSSDNTVSIFLNDGSGGYSSASTLATGSNPRSLATGDFDNANGMDFVVANYNDSDVRVYINNGSGSFTTTDYSTGSGAVDAAVADFDGDGYLDIAVHNRSASSAYILLNDGDGTFTSSGTVSASSNMDRIFAADIDGDNDMDIAMGGTGMVLFTAKNNGDGTFASATNTGITSYEAEFADLDGDDDLDLVVSDDGSNEVSVHLNDGSGSFGSATDYTVADARDISIVDYNGDGDMDIVAVSYSGSFAQVLENNGSGIFTTGQTFDVGSSAYRQSVADLDKDGQLDFVTANLSANTISINYGEEFVEVTSVSPTTNSMGVSATSNITATFNSDMNAATLTSSTVLVNGSYSGLLSGVVTYDSPSKTMTFNPVNDFKAGEEITVTFTKAVENSNGNSLTNAETFKFTAEASGTGVGYFEYSSESGIFPSNVSQFVAGDLNNDGDLDIAGESNNTMYIRLNSGSGSFASPTEYFIQGANSMKKADLDNDGDLDLLVITTSNKLLFLENDANGAYTRADSISTNSFVGEDNFGVGDFNKDGIPDIALVDATGAGANAIYVYTNDGNMNFTSFYQSNDLDNSDDIVIADLNNDEFPDFVLADRYESFAIMLNNGDGTYASEVSYSTPTGSRNTIAATDLDGDGYLDLAISNYYANSEEEKFSVRINNGDGSFASATHYSLAYDGFAITTGDMDADGDQDIIFANGIANQSSIAFNNGSGGITETVNYTVQTTNSGGVVMDYDGDGDLDIIYPDDSNMSILTNTVPVTPASAVSSISFSNNFGEQVDANWSNGDGTGRLVVMKQGSAVDATPTDDVFYTADDFGSGSELGTGNYVVYAGTDNSATITGLTTNTEYHIAVYEYNKGGSLIKYLTTTPGTGNVTTVDVPTNDASDLSFSEVKDGSFILSWGNGNGQNRLVVVKEGSAVDGTPSDNTSYTAGEFGSGSEIGTGNYVVYNGSGSSATVTGLSAETTYHVAIFEYNGADGSGRFKTDTPATGSQKTLPTPTIWSKNDSTLTFTKADYADWTLAVNQDRVSDNIWFTRQDDSGLFNYADETGWNGSASPSGTKWALGTTDNLESLTFDSFRNTLDGSIGDNIVDADMVVFVESENLYFDINFSSWTQNGEGGGFSYTRAKGPEPTPIIQSFQDSAGYAVQFDGGNTQEEFIEIYIEDYEIISEFSVEMWVKPDVINQDQVFIALGYDDLFIGINSSNQFYATHTEPNAGGGGGEGECCLLKGISATSTSSGASYSSAEIDGLGGSITASVGEWYHVALTGRSGDYLTLYVNGVEQDTVSVEDVSVDESYWVVGSDEDRSKNFFGTIDELRIWKSVRTESEIRSFMHRTYSGPVGRLTGYWQFNEGSGGYTYDGLNNHEGEFYDGIEETWVTSDAPIGEGAVEETTDFQTGTVSVGNAALSMADGFDNPVDVQVTEVTGSPNQFPAGVTAGIGGKYFVINLFGDPGTFSADLTLNFGSGAITAEQETFPELLTLYKRGSSSTGAWTTVGGATSANAATGEVTWTGITSFSQFMATGGEYSFQANDGEPISAAVVSGPSFGSILLDNDVFGFDPVYADSTIEFHISGFGGAEVGIVSDDNENGIAEPGTDPFVTANDAENPVSFTPSTSKLMYISGGGTIDTTTFYFSYYDSEADVTELDTVFAVFGVSDSDEATLENNESENGWYLLSIPQNSSIGSFLSPVWTQGAVNSDAPGSDATIYTFNPDNAAYQAVTTDLDTTTLAAGEGLLVYVFEDDDILDGQDDVDGGWPKTLTITGDLFGLNASVPVKNVDADGISGTTGSEGFVLLGNPFGWPISADSVIATLKRTDELANSYVYTWDPVNKTYILSTSGEIDAFESFFVRVVNSGTSGSLSFDYHDVIVSESSPSEKIQNSDMLEFDLVHKNSGIESTSFLRFAEKAQTDIDPYDGYYLGSFASSFANLYTLIGDQPLTINNVPLEADFDKEFPIFMDATVSGNFSLNWKDGRMPEGISATLTHVETGKSFNLNEGGSFEFSIDNSSLSKVAKEMQPVPSSEVVQMAKEEKAEPLFVLSMSSRLGTSNESDLGIPTEVELYQNYPNPFNPTSVIRFGVPEASKVKLEVFDVLGRKVATLLNNETKSSGRYNVQFNARALSSGMYIYRLQVGDKVLVKKMTLIK